MNLAFRRLMDLSKKTGDRLIITDPDGEDAFVLMAVDQYEALLQPSTTSSPKDVWEAMPQAGSGAETWDMEELGKEEQEQMAKQYEAYLRRNMVQQDVKDRPATSTPEMPIPEEPQKPDNRPSSADLYNEDQFYLEPIE